jgi:hypothetical protein
MSQASRDSFTLADLVLKGEPVTQKKGHQDMHIEINSEIHYFMNTDDNYNICDISDTSDIPNYSENP